MKKKYLLFLLIIGPVSFLKAQKLSISPFLGLHYSNIDYIKKGDAKQDDFETPGPKIAELWGIDINYRCKKILHQLTLQNTVIGEAFEIKNKYVLRTPEQLLGSYKQISQGGDDYLQLKYSAKKEFSKTHKFFGKSNFKLAFSLGMGIVFDRTQDYYDNTFHALYASFGGGGGPNGEYFYYQWWLKEHNSGVLATVGVGINVYKKTGKQLLYIEAFYSKGLRQMLKYSIDYKYGYTQYPQYQTEVHNQIIRTRGTSFGFKIGVPIKILK